MNGMNVEACLEDLEHRIDPEVEDRLQAEWIDFIEGRFEGDVFSPGRATKTPPAVSWPEVSVNRAQVDLDAMVIQQYGACSRQLARGAGCPMAVRTNYGTGIMPSIFGAELFVMDEELGTLQTTRPLGSDATVAAAGKGVPDLETGLGSKVFEAGRRFAEIASTYPKIGRYVHIYHPDMQGPMDICEMLWGSPLFVDLIDKPDDVHGALDVITETYVRFMRAWDDTVGTNGRDWSAHWGVLMPGKIMIRTDSGMNLSPDHYDEFIRPYDQRLFDEFGGGAVHFCGRGSHYIESCCAMAGMRAINMSQPHLNDMETIYRHTVDKGVLLLGFSREYAEKAVAEGRDMHGRVHC